ncbi:ClpX C4-type zinc finger [Acetobacteraceae bacterium AT-5844]|nr:ClpX C4-type zinc finger [Acetobacteraceae bacterium AT-5844]
MTRTMRCSFCDKSQHEVLKLLAGGSAFICNGCVDEANAIIKPDPDRTRVLAEAGPAGLTDLKTALEGLRDTTPTRFGGKSTDPYGFTIHTTKAVANVLEVSKRAGLLSDEKPEDALEVARKALEELRQDARAANCDRFPMSAAWVAHKLATALSAIERAKGEGQ